MDLNKECLYENRILAGLALVPLLLLVALGGLPLYIGEFVIVAIAIHEFYKAFETKKTILYLVWVCICPVFTYKKLL